jgi:hypothetical protein
VLGIGSLESAGDRGRLQLVRDSWLVCHGQSCGRKYPVYDGVPIMLLERAERWIGVDVEDLPPPPLSDFQRIPYEEPSIGADDGGLTALEKMGAEWRLKKHHVVIILFLIGLGLGFLIAHLRH